MPHSYSNILLHIVFSTKHRIDFITSEVESGLYGAIGNTLRALNCKAICIGGVANHVHIFCRSARTIEPCKLVEQIKTDSTKWIKKQGVSFADFAWQTGYGAFSVSHTHADALSRYIEDQKAHHAVHEFKYEFLTLLDKNGVEYEEEFLWT